MWTNKIKNWCKENKISVLLIIGTILGLFAGLLVRQFIQLSPITLKYVSLPGKLVIRVFMMILVPLVVTSLSLGIASTKSGENKRMIILTFFLFVSFTTYSALFGMTMVFITRPGVRQHTVADNSTISEYESFFSAGNQKMSSSEDSLYDILINMIPDNLITATFMSHYTALVPINPNNLTLGYNKVNEHSYRTNMLGLCVFSLILGFAIMSLESKAETIKRLLLETNTIVMHLIMSFLKYEKKIMIELFSNLVFTISREKSLVMPIGMFCLMFVEAVKMKSLTAVLSQLGLFFATVYVTFSIHLFLVLPGIYFLVVRRNPYKLYANIIPAIIVALSSSSSSVTLPMTLKCMEDKSKLDKSVTQFVLPLGMTLNMNGSALYYPMVTVFVAQMHGVSFNLQLILVLCLFAVMMSMAMSGVYTGGSSIVNFIAYSAVIGITDPLDVLAYIMPVDWFNDRLRTTINIIGDCFVAEIVQKLCIKKERHFQIDQ